MKNLLDFALNTPGKAQVKLRDNPNEIFIFTVYNLNKNLLSRHNRQFHSILNEHIQTFTVTHAQDMRAIVDLEKESKSNYITEDSFIHFIKNLEWQDLILYLNENNNSFKFLSLVNNDKLNHKDILDIVFNQLNILADKGIEHITVEEKNALIHNLYQFKNLFAHHREYYTTKICQFLSFVAWEDTKKTIAKKPLNEWHYTLNEWHYTNIASEHFNSISSDLFSINYIIEKDLKNIQIMIEEDMNLYSLNEKSIKKITLICAKQSSTVNQICAKKCENSYKKMFMLARHKSWAQFCESHEGEDFNLETAKYKKFLFTSLQNMKKDCIDLIDTDTRKIIISLYDSSTDKLKQYLQKDYSMAYTMIEKMKLNFLLENQHTIKTLNKL